MLEGVLLYHRSVFTNVTPDFRFSGVGRSVSCTSLPSLGPYHETFGGITTVTWIGH